MEKSTTDSFTIEDLYRLIRKRKENPSTNSYTCALFCAGRDEILKKLGEEAIEVIIAANGQGRERLTEELADLCYHALVLMASQDISPDDILTELKKRSKGRGSS
ncbi:MAG: phosphoribosyl-ATP diphosphatase [Candidatus Magnetominusculus sp. LBB02]|nr:phosphoribosyl-ATP diphosphatase [Candidatus Magnetominusculus sp. LBB02]